MSESDSARAVIVGATGTMGMAIVQRLLERDIPILAVARDAKRLAQLSATNPLIATCATDIAENDAERAIANALDGPVRMAVFAAGLPVRGSVDTIDPEALAVGANVKLGGVVRLLRALKDKFVERHGRFVVFAGSLGVEPTAHEAGPGAINAGLFNLMRQISHLYGPRGITTHTICAGPADTPRLRNIANRVAEERGIPFEDIWREYIERNSLGRLPSPKEMAWAVTLLLDPEADVMHGGVLKLDAGGLKTVF